MKHFKQYFEYINLMKHHIMQINHIPTLILYYRNKISTTEYVKEKQKKHYIQFSTVYDKNRKK